MKEKIFLTGVTGFLGKVVAEEILRRFPDAELKVLVRPGFEGGQSGEERFQREVINTQCFSHLPEGWADRIEVIEGDITKDLCGLSKIALDSIADVTRFIHCAATVEFDLPLKQAADLNIEGTLNVLELCRYSNQLQKLIYVSTAYVTPVVSGKSQPIFERLVPLKFDPSEMYRKIRNERIDETTVMESMKLPNTYTVTKCLAEHLLIKGAGDLPVEIVRPSIISAAWERPHAGWIDSMAAFAGIVALTALGKHKVFAGHADTPLDIVPVDFVADRIIERCFAKYNRSLRVTHATVGVKSSTTVSRAHELVIDWYTRLPVSGDYPKNHYIGVNSMKLRVKDWRHHQMPQLLYKMLLKLGGKSTRRLDFLRKKQKFINQGFTYFVTRTFDFRSAHPHPELESINSRFNSDEYIRRVCAGIYQNVFKLNSSQAPLLTSKIKVPGLKLRRSLSSHQYHPSIRMLSQTLASVGRMGGVDVTYDYQALNKALSQVKDPSRLVLVSAHRSYTDFLLWPLLCFSESHLGIPMPRIAAAEEFSRLPVLNKVFSHCGAFYIKRGKGKADPTLRLQLSSLVREGQLNQPLLFFIEGTRSRTGQFLSPKRGILRCLEEITDHYTVLPLSLVYDRVPEQKVFSRELYNKQKSGQSLSGLFKWSRELLSGKVKMGRVHMSCGQPVVVSKGADIRQKASQILGEIQQNTAVSRFHLRNFLMHHPINGVSQVDLEQALLQRGAVLLDSPLGLAQYSQPSEESYSRFQWEHFFYADALRYFGETAFAYLSENWHEPRSLEDFPVIDMNLLRAIFADRFDTREALSSAKQRSIESEKDLFSHWSQRVSGASVNPNA